ncbi:MAG: histidine phosphatase family protein [Firmicutes bacterium]|nr:histidine phosphatase family protein [Bacillota bacterium]
MELVLIRHGLTKGNEEKRYIGKSDEALSTNGMNQLIKNIYPSVSQIFVSPKLRCIQTCELIYPDQEYEIISSFEEMDFGEFEGKNYQELNGDEMYQAWIDSNGTLPFPKGESKDEFIERVKRGFEQMCEKIQENKVACIVHGGTIMAILSSFSSMDYFDGQCKNGNGFVCTLHLKDSIKIDSIRSLL